MNYKVLENDEFRLELSINTKDSYYYYAYRNSDNAYIGNFGIRLEKNKTNYYLGNIEYEIFDEYRGNNYAEKVTRLLSEVALSFNIESLIITADPKNIASIKTISNLGAKFIEVKKVPKKSKLYRNKNSQVAIYEWNIRK